jgi:DNA repair exonuclease SbcCD ATPase subunit
MNTEQKRKRIELAVKLGALGLVSFIVSPVILLVLKGMVGLIAAIAVGWAAIWFTPVVASMFANWRIKALKAEAFRNPIETLQNQYIKGKEKLADFREKIKDSVAEFENFKSKLAGFVQKYPQEAQKFEDAKLKLSRLITQHKTRFQKAEQELEAQQAEIVKASAIWDMANALNAASDAVGMTEEDFFARIQTETAFDSVTKNFNSALAELEVGFLEETEVKASAGVALNTPVTKEKIGINN